MKPSQTMFFIVMLLLFAAGNAYVFYRLWRMIPPTAPAVRITVAVLGALAVAAFFVGMLVRSASMPVGLVSLLQKVGTSWIFIFLYLLIIFLAADLLRVTHLLPMHKIMYGNWLSLAILTAIIAAVFTLGNINYHNKRRVVMDIEAAVARPLKIVAVSDLHLGYTIGPKELARWVDMINREKPDAVLIAGDLIDNSTRPLWEKDFAAQLRRIDAPHGVYLAPGNHEYISGMEESIRFAEAAGIKVLDDTAVLIDSTLWVAGRDDRSNPGRKSVAELTEGLDRKYPVVMLDHQPYGLAEAQEAGIALQLSGHTHRGQVWPFTWVTDAMYEVSHGYLRKGDTHYWVSTGLGIWGGKFRIGSRSEYIIVNIVPRLE